jgi:outer membrane protein
MIFGKMPMNVKTTVFFLTCCAALAMSARAQPLLSLDDAVAIALKNNYDVMVARKNAEIAKINNTAGNAGMLPAIAATGSDNYGLNDIDQKPAAGPETNSSGDHANAAGAGVFLNWTLFDGGKMFVTKNKLAEIEKLGDLQFRDRVLQTVYGVIAAYYNVVRQKQQLASLEVVTAYNEDRVAIARTGFNSGLLIKTNLLQAQLDLNVNRENAIQQKTVINDAKRTLNQFLSRDPEIDFEVADSIPLRDTLDKIALLKKIDENNTGLLELKKQVAIARLSVDEARSLVFPKVAFSAGYQFQQSNNSFGSIAMNRVSGPQIGGTITFPLFQGGNAVRQISTAKLQLKSVEFTLESARIEIDAEVRSAIEDFETQRRILEIEKENSVIAKENLDISMARLKQGQATTLEVHLAQESYQNSLTRLITIRYEAKVAETKLRQLAAAL